MSDDQTIQNLEEDCEKLRNIIQSLEKKVKELIENENEKENEKENISCYVCRLRRYFFGN